MQKILKKVIIALFLSAFLYASANAQVRVSAQIDDSADIYVGEDFGYFIVIENSEAAGQPDLNVLRDYDPRHNGNRQQSSTQIINNRVTSTQYIVMTYLLRANKIGRIELPSVPVTVDGKEYKTNPVQVNILKPGTTDQLDLEVELSEKQCYVGQPVIMTIKFYVSAAAGIEDFSFDIPAFSSGDFYLEEPDDVNPQAKQYQLGSGIVVYVNNYRTTHNGRESILVTFRKVLIPKRAGVINIEPTTVTANMAVGRTNSRNSIFDVFGSNIQYKRFMVSTESIDLNVLNLPDQGRPDGFYGLVGNYSISSSASPTEVCVGDPITLNIKIGDNKYLKPIQWPALEQIPELAGNFKIPSEKASPFIENDFKVFTQTIRASNDKVMEIPSIPLVYFDTDKGDYVTAKTDPIKIEVSPTRILTGSDLQGSDFTSLNKEVEAIKQGLSANYQDISALESHEFSLLAAIVNPGYLVIWAGPLMVLLLSAFTKFYAHTTPEKEARKRRRSASGRAVSQLKSISVADSQGHVDVLAGALKQYIGERFDRTSGSLTSDDCYQVIAESTNNIEIAKKYKEIIADCEAARYASAGASIDMHRIQEAIELVHIIEKSLKNNV